MNTIDNIMLDPELVKIKTVEDLDTKQKVKLDLECWAVYAYLSSFGYSHGYNSIYPNQDQMSVDLGINIRTLQRKLKLLVSAGFVVVTRHTIGSKRDKNSYKLRIPKMIPRVRYLDINGNLLQGKLYTFDKSVFNRKHSEGKRDIHYEMVCALKQDVKQISGGFEMIY